MFQMFIIWQILWNTCEKYEREQHSYKFISNITVLIYLIATITFYVYEKLNAEIALYGYKIWLSFSCIFISWSVKQ